MPAQLSLDFVERRQITNLMAEASLPVLPEAARFRLPMSGECHRHRRGRADCEAVMVERRVKDNVCLVGMG
jgi:hypothetical protein